MSFVGEKYQAHGVAFGGGSGRDSIR
jgi:hypothetical protein